MVLSKCIHSPCVYISGQFEVEPARLWCTNGIFFPKMMIPIPYSTREPILRPGKEK